MLINKNGWTRVVEVNPPDLPDMSHALLENTWRNVLITDNVFGRIRVSPFAYAARVTHDVPDVHPTVVVSTRDRNILAIESEVRGALGNGVNSFLVVTGDTVPAVDHLAHHYEIVEHLRELQGALPDFEVGMPTRFRDWQYQRRKDAGAQYFVCGPVMDPATVAPNMERLNLDASDPPLYVMLIPPFGPGWVTRMEAVGTVPITDPLRSTLDEANPRDARQIAWELCLETEAAAREAGAAGVILMGLRFDTVVKEAPTAWPDPSD